MVQYAHLIRVLREHAIGAHDITNAGRYEKSSCSDNKSTKNARSFVIICLDWAALSHSLVWRPVFFFGTYTPSEKYLGPQQSPPISHNDLKYCLLNVVCKMIVFYFVIFWCVNRCFIGVSM